MIHLAKQRQSGYLIFHPQDKIISGQELNEFLQNNPIINQNNLPNHNSNQEITGKVAYEGQISGTAKIVKSQEDLWKVNQGDILITVMTTPDFIQAMEKASAFITDEGGILCHASIVAREMQKPCLIGTKIATKVLKDGDQIHLDATNGVVKILNH